MPNNEVKPNELQGGTEQQIFEAPDVIHEAPGDMPVHEIMGTPQGGRRSEEREGRQRGTGVTGGVEG